MFESSRTYGLFTAYFDSELYHYAANYHENNVFGRNRPLYAVVGVTQVLEAIEVSQRNRTLNQNMKHFLEQDFATIHDNAQVPGNFKPYITARIDVKLVTTEGDFQIISVSDEKATVDKPNWFQKDGVGYVIQTCAGKLEIKAKTTVKGQVTFRLRGMDIRTPEDKSKRVPYWIDYTKFEVDGKTVFDKLTPVWHDKLYRHSIAVEAGEEIKIQVEWLPHRSDT